MTIDDTAAQALRARAQAWLDDDSDDAGALARGVLDLLADRDALAREYAALIEATFLGPLKGKTEAHQSATRMPREGERSMTLAELREEAAEHAEVRVSALLQAFALPHVGEEQIRRLLIDAITNAHVAGYAEGWDAALDKAREALDAVERFKAQR